jgi:hypothetical protein
MALLTLLLIFSVSLNVLFLVFIFRANAKMKKASSIIWDMDIEVKNCYFHSKKSDAENLEKVVFTVGKACNDLKHVIPDEREFW